MSIEHASSAADPSRPVLTVATAREDYRERAQQHAEHCVLLAVVTSPEVSAELIDRAIALTRGPVAPVIAGAA